MERRNMRIQGDNLGSMMSVGILLQDGEELKCLEAIVAFSAEFTVTDYPAYKQLLRQSGFMLSDFNKRRS